MSMIFIFILVTALPTASAFQKVVTDVRCRLDNWDDIFLGQSSSKGDYGGNDGKLFEKTCQKNCHDSEGSEAKRNRRLMCGYSYRNAADLSDSDNVVVDVVTTININSCSDNSYVRIADWDAEGRRAEATNRDTGSRGFWICAKKRSIRDVQQDINAGRSVKVVTGFAATITDDPMSEPNGATWKYLGKWDNHNSRDAIAFTTDDDGFTDAKYTKSEIFMWQRKADISLEKPVTVLSYWKFKPEPRGSISKDVTEKFSFTVDGREERDERTYKDWQEKVTKSTRFYAGVEKKGLKVGVESKNEKETKKQREDELRTISERTWQQDKEVEVEFTIPASETDGVEYVNLWYWVVTARETDAAPDSQEFDDSFSAEMTYKLNSIEKSGCGYELPPNCLPGYCLETDPNCFRCRADFAVIDPNFEEPRDCINECSWKAVPSDQCPATWELRDIMQCGSGMNDGELCKTNDSRLPSGVDAQVQNCGTQNVFRYECIDSYSKCWIYNIGGNACGELSDVWYEDTWGRDHGSWDSEEKCLAEKEAHERFCEAKSYFCYAQDSSQCIASDNVCSEHPGAVMIPETSNGGCGGRPAARCGRNGECCSCCGRYCSRREGSAVGDEDALALENRRLKKTQAALMKALKTLKAN